MTTSVGSCVYGMISLNYQSFSLGEKEEDNSWAHGVSTQQYQRPYSAKHSFDLHARHLDELSNAKGRFKHHVT